MERGGGVFSKGETYHASSLGNSTNSKCYSDGGEHALVDSKQEIGNLARAYGRSGQDIAEPDVFQVTDVLARSVGERERETPEEPLEGDDCSCHDGQPDQGQRRLSPSETGIEEAVEGLSAIVLPSARFRICTYPTPGIMSKTSAVAVIIHAISPA